MLNGKQRNLLLGIIKHCERIKTKARGLTFEAFAADQDIQEIICFNILQIGELANRFDEDFLVSHRDAPWRKIKGMRNRVAHGYDTLDMPTVWDTAEHDIEPLLSYCRAILETESVI